MFDEKIFMYFEEPDIAKRIDEKKYTILYEKSKKYIHLVGDRTAWSERAFTSEMNSLKYYLTKYNFDTANIINKYLEEYKFKVLAAKFLNDKNRLIKFQNEIKQIEKVFDIK
jgi:GT2 family glycosyltransferase